MPTQFYDENVVFRDVAIGTCKVTLRQVRWMPIILDSVLSITLYASHLVLVGNSPNHLQ